MQNAAHDVERLWAVLRPTIAARHAELAKHTDGIVKRVSDAKTPSQFSAAAKPLLDEVDELEKVFTHQ